MGVVGSERSPVKSINLEEYVGALLFADSITAAAERGRVGISGAFLEKDAFPIVPAASLPFSLSPREAEANAAPTAGGGVVIFLVASIAFEEADAEEEEEFEVEENVEEGEENEVE